MNSNLPSIFLHQGEICIKSEPAVVTTILGSCIAVIMFSPVYSTGAICHAVMPEGEGKDRGRYVDTAMEDMLAGFAERGIKKGGIRVKLFGGGRMFSRDYSLECRDCVGDRNIRKALEVIAEYRLNLVASDVGGCEGRKIMFYPHNGSVWVKKLNRREIV